MEPFYGWARIRGGIRCRGRTSSTRIDILLMPRSYLLLLTFIPEERQVHANYFGGGHLCHTHILHHTLSLFRFDHFSLNLHFNIQNLYVNEEDDVDIQQSRGICGFSF